ncbi:hypothetical protein OJ998_09620 [Solirubrobacter taibaiensis]|nr:hypothetical protein [Solirubrobacter taibaiensis]
MESKVARRAARLLAAALAVGALVTAIPGLGLARMVEAVTGYAEFGYAPEQCAIKTTSARAINGDPVRVCQYDFNTTSAFFGGHEGWPLLDSSAEFHFSLPDAGITFAACCEGDDVFPAFSTPAFGPVVAGDPLSGASTSTAIHNGTKYADVVETARVRGTGADGYTLTYAVTNTSGAPLRLRPLVDMTGYGYYPPAMSATAGPRILTLRSADAGGVVTLGESAVDGSPAPTSYTGGAYEEIWEYDDPSGPPLDNTFHPMSDELWGYETRAALAWPIQTLAAGATGRWSVNVGLGQPREVQLKARAGEPQAGGTLTVDASVIDERGVAGGQLRWLASGRTDATEGVATLDAAGRAALTLPVGDGGTYVVAWYDVNRNDEVDIDEAVNYGEIWATPRPGVDPTPTPSPIPTAEPDDEPVPTATPTPNPIVRATPTPPAAAPPAAVRPTSALVSIAFKRTYKVKGCASKTVQLQLKAGTKVLVKRNVKLSKKCQANTTFRVERSKLGSAKKVTIQLKFKGKTKRYTLSVPAQQLSRTASAQSAVCAASLKSGGGCNSSGAESAALCKLSAARALPGRTIRSLSGSGRIAAAGRCAE